jgi:hypothetical protein
MHARIAFALASLSLTACSGRPLGLPDPVLAWESLPCVYRFPSIDGGLAGFANGDGDNHWWRLRSHDTSHGSERRYWEVHLMPPVPRPLAEDLFQEHPITSFGRVDAVGEGCGTSVYRGRVRDSVSWNGDYFRETPDQVREPRGRFDQIDGSSIWYEVTYLPEYETPFARYSDCFRIEAYGELVPAKGADRSRELLLDLQDRNDVYCPHAGLVERTINGETFYLHSRSF